MRTNTNSSSSRNGNLGCAILVVVIATAFTGAFHSHVPRLNELGIIRSSSQQQQHQANYYGQQRQNSRIALKGWFADAFESLGLDMDTEKKNLPQQSTDSNSNKKQSSFGTVIRTASKIYSDSSEPSHASYITRKESQSKITIAPEGVVGDHNHYRTVALDATPDRAVSILTQDVLELLQKQGWPQVSQGDLGENILIEGVDYTFFKVGQKYKFDAATASDTSTIVEITERIEPCGNLCKLSFINDESLPPKERFEGCKKFLLTLDAKEGLRGWYGRVIGNGGIVSLGDKVSLVGA